MNARSRGVAVAAALMVGIGALTASAGQAQAAPNHPKDNGVRCAVKNPPGSAEEYTFYLPGEVVTNETGARLRCGADGTWSPVQGASGPGGIPNPGGSLSTK